jgi:hypothetical protein
MLWSRLIRILVDGDDFNTSLNTEKYTILLMQIGEAKGLTWSVKWSKVIVQQFHHRRIEQHQIRCHH